MGGPIRSYHDLVAWQKAFALGIAVYRFTDGLPDHERFGLTVSLRRSALLVARLIAEGYGKQNPAAYVQFLRNARSTTYDIDTQLHFAVGLKYTSEEECRPLIEQTADCGRVISGLIRSMDGSSD